MWTIFFLLGISLLNQALQSNGQIPAGCDSAAAMKTRVRKTEMFHFPRKPDHVDLQVCVDTCKRLEMFKYLGITFANDECVDQSWCTIPAFSTYCDDPDFRLLMRKNCPNFCGICTNATTDDPRCTSDNGGCEHRCTIKNNQVKCECYRGYELTSNGKNCTDFDECQQANVCPDITKPFCVNQIGSYLCSNQSCSESIGWRNRYLESQCCRAEQDVSCGRDPKVYTIRDVQTKWPWIVYILIDNRVLCGGTLISDSWVVTAAHCFRTATPNSTITAFFGRLNPNAHEPHVQERNVIEIKIPENWDRNRFPYHDIALMRLGSPVELGLTVNLLCLPNGEVPEPGTRCWVAGYGTMQFQGQAAESLQEVDLIVTDSETCVRSYQNFQYPIQDDIMLCAGHKEGGKDSCRGDSGGPLMCQRCDSCQWYLAGVMSFGRGCARPNYFGVFTAVEYYEEWISSQSGIPVNKNKRCGD